MAAAADYLDDDEFDDYNPHPYNGGYDISATYGAPLPPSPSTCYPVVSSAPAAPAPIAPPAPFPARATPPPSSPAKQPRSISPEPRKPSPPPVAEPYYWPKPYDYGDGPRGQPVYATPEVFRGWPYLPGPQCYSRCGRDYWRQCMRGLDYLFGHSDGYGERRIGADCHGVPVYANRKGVEDAVVVEVAPPAIGNVEWHHAGEEPAQSNRLSWHDHAKEDTYAYAQPTYGSYADKSYEQSYSLHAVSDEPTWFPNQSYQDVYNEEESHYQEFLSSYDADNKISSQPIYCYNQHFGEQPLHVQVEPPEATHKLEYYENLSAYNYQNDIDNLEIWRHSCETQHYAHTANDTLEPYKSSWSMNLGYYQDCTEGVAPEYDNHNLSSGEYGDMANLFVTSFYPQQTQIYEHSHGDQNVSLQQNLQSNWSVLSEDASQITTSGDDFNHLNVSFWPFGEYATYTV